jgi:hypothetical protein
VEFGGRGGLRAAGCDTASLAQRIGKSIVTESQIEMTGRLRTACAVWMLPALLLLVLPAAMQAQFNYTTNNGTAKYTGGQKWLTSMSKLG